MPDNIKPVSKKNRIDVLDVIRGFAIFGILMANIQSWSGYKFIPFEEIQRLSYYEYNDLLHNLFMLFIDTKFYALFSILFGIGFFLQFNKFREDQKEFILTYRRRLGFLMLFGAIHAFFWSGDILFIYGLVGFVFILFRNFSKKTLLLLSIFFYYAWLIKDIVVLYYFPQFISHTAPTAYKTYADISPAEIMYYFQQGTFLEVLHTNWHNLFWRYIDLLPAGRLSKVLALFLFGYYLMSIDYFRNAAMSLRLTILYWTGGLIISVMAGILGGHMAQFASKWGDIEYKILAVTGQILLALAYINTLTILYKKDFFKKLLYPLTFVGRMSFSNYIMHTVFGYLIFYPFFGNLFGKLSLLEIIAVAFFLYITQIFISWLWLKYFRFGPLEWVWRCLTYKKIFPIRTNKA